jgi:hypothetical protein
MHESDDDLAAVQDLLDRSHAGSGEHLRRAFSQDQRLSAAELVDALPGIFEMHLAVVTPTGAPLVAPVDGFLVRGKVCLGLPAASVRTGLVRRDPRVSASYIGERASFIVHGAVVETDDELFESTATELYVAQYGDWFRQHLEEQRRTGGAGLSGVIEPRVLFAKR